MIAYDAASEDKVASGASSLTYAHTCTGSNRFIYVAVTTINDATHSVTATYGGVSMTAVQVDQLIYSSTNWYHHGFRLAAPASGSNNVVITKTNADGSIRSGAVSYTGVDQTTPINVSAKGNGTATPATLTSTSTVTGWWVMSAANIDLGHTGGSITDTLRAEYSGLADIADSGNDVASGSATTTMPFPTGTRQWGAIHFLMVPAATGTTVSPAVQTATFSLPTRTVTGKAQVSPSAQVATFSTPSRTVTGKALVSVNVQSATFTIPAYIVSAGGVILNPSVQTLTFSLPTRSLIYGSNISLNQQNLTFTVQVPTVTADWTVSVNPITLTFTLPTLEFVGALWGRTARTTTGADWSRSSVNNDA